MAVSHLADAVDGYPKVFFVTFQKAEDEYLSTGKDIHPHLEQLMGLGYQQAQKESIGDINIYELRK
jgi:hypothetical protein